jgi:GTP pyrophosphokinase
MPRKRHDATSLKKPWTYSRHWRTGWASGSSNRSSKISLFDAWEPEAYRRVSDGLDRRHADRGRYIAQVVARLREELHRAGISAEISGRPKHVFSVWTKMREKGLDLSGVFDVLGFRILVNDVSKCYAALGVVHGLWEPILDAFDDYIAKPKLNGYQSLHSAAIGPDGVTIEVQIRTFAMHRHADLGVAAHWQYKEGLQRRIAWSRSFLESGESTPHDIDIIERFKQAALHDRIYVLTPQGHIIDLPADATPPWRSSISSMAIRRAPGII